MDERQQAGADAASPLPKTRLQWHDSPAADDDGSERLRALLDEAKQSEAEARRAVGLLNTIIDLLPVGVTVQSQDGAVLIANRMAETLSGSGTKGAPAGPSCGVLDAPAPDPVGDSAADNADGALEERIVGQGDAGERTLLICRKPVHIFGRPLLVSTSFDFTARKRAEIELSKRAYVDDLTGLPNGILIQDHVLELLAGSDSCKRFALALLDIDNFKNVNDYYTHSVGDALLQKVAQRIATHLRATDVVGRLSGDEFLLVLSPLVDDGELAGLLGRLLQELREPFLIEGYEILTSASIGASVYPEHGLNFETLRRAADTAKNRVKEAAKGAVALFDTDMGRAMAMRMAREQRLRLAVRDGRFCCAFQPKVDIRTEDVIGLEALIRLRDEDGMIQGPGEFIGLATELGLIDDITYLALAEILRSIDLLDEAFGPQTSISINIAAKQASDEKFMNGFCDELAACGFADRFMIEVTEDAFLAKSRFQTDFLPRLREIGARVSVDDFGTGYSSLATLADVTADEIKIDRSFITAIHQRPRSQSVLKAIEALSEALGMTVIAEGVETFEEVAYLQAATRIRFAQGFYFAKPILLNELAPTRRIVGDARSGAMPRERTRARGRGAR